VSYSRLPIRLATLDDVAKAGEATDAEIEACFEHGLVLTIPEAEALIRAAKSVTDGWPLVSGCDKLEAWLLAQ
jgi:hypothetical protein